MGSGKGYLSSFLSLQYGLQVYGIDSSSTNTHGAQERNRKLKKFSRVYQKQAKAARTPGKAAAPRGISKVEPGLKEDEDVLCVDASRNEEERVPVASSSSAAGRQSEWNPDSEELFLSALSADVMEPASPRVPPSQLSDEEKERRKRENLERKAQSRRDGASDVFSPLTSFVTAETELRELITELEVRLRCQVKVPQQLPTAPSKITAQLRQLEVELLKGGWWVWMPNLHRVIINKFYHLSSAFHLSSVLLFLCGIPPYSRTRSWSACTHVETWLPAR